MAKLAITKFRNEIGEPREGKITNITLKLNILLGKKSTH
jgi:hypothetical protein